MAKFLNDVLTDLHNKSIDIASLTFVLPNKRAGLFLKKEFSNLIQQTSFAPITLSIEEFVQDLSGLTKTSPLETLFELYSVYIEQTDTLESESFDVFVKWAQTLLQDFNEIDRFLVEPDAIFNYITAIKEIEGDHWSLEKNQTALINNHIAFWKSLSNYYTALTQKLTDLDLGYDGLIYRVAVDQLESFIQSHSNQHYVFVGFNALNRAEELIIQELLHVGMASIYWDIDMALISQPDVGHFIRSYQKWKYFRTHAFQWETNNYSELKTIKCIGVAKNIGQAKYVGELLDSLCDQNTPLSTIGVVLNDESLLLPTLTSIPRTISKLNVTMGLQLKQTPLYTLFELLFAFQAKNKSSIYYKDLIDVIMHPYVVELFTDNSTQIILNYLKDNNFVFVSIENIIEQIPENSLVIRLLFDSWNNEPKTGIANCQKLLLLMKAMTEKQTNGNSIALQYQYSFHSIFSSISNLNQKYGFINSTKVLAEVFKDIVKSETIDFKGEPLEGLQIMGMLETRVIDFDTLIITSVNEGVLPAGKRQNSFIPFDVKIENKLPTYKEKDAVYAYHFYRLLQYAKNVYLLYNTEPDVLNGGEKSRFITQLEIEGQHQIEHQVISPVVPVIQNTSHQIMKTKVLLEQLKSLSKSGFSPTSLTQYIRNPMDFYKRYVLGINPQDEVEETIAANTLGTVVHESLKLLYAPLLNKALTPKMIQALVPKINEVVLEQFKHIYKKGGIEYGKNLIVFEVAKRYILNFLNSELKMLEQGNSITVLEVEGDVKVPIAIDDLEFEVNLKGQIDRVDLCNGTLRIIDYKTGLVEPQQVKINEWADLTTDYKKYSKSFQVLFYAYILNCRSPFTHPVEAGIISFKNLGRGFMKFEQQGEGALVTNATLLHFEKELKNLILEIFDPHIAFIEKETS